MAHPPPSLEDAIGLPAVLKLRDYLLTLYPVDQFVARTNTPAKPAGWGHPKHGDKYAVVPYKCEVGRQWYKVVVRETGETAVRLGRHGRIGIRQDYMLSADEAWRKIDELP